MGESSAIVHGQGTIGTTRGQVAATYTEGTDSIAIQALAGNTGVVYVGGSGVTIANGWPLAAGQAISIDIISSTGIYVIGSLAGQNYAYLQAN